MIEPHHNRPGLSPNVSASDRAARPGRRLHPAWWAGSILVHLALIAAVVGIAPLNRWMFEPTPQRPPVEPGQARIDRLVEALEAEYRSKLAREARRLQRIEREMADLGRDRFFRFRHNEPSLADLSLAHITRAQYHRMLEQWHAARLAEQRIDLRPDQQRVASLVRQPRVPTATQLERAGIRDLYDELRAGELRIAQQYERLTLINAATRQRRALSEVVSVNTMALPDRPSLNEAALERRITALYDGHFDALKRQLLTAGGEAVDMRRHCENLLNKARGMGRDDDGAVTLWRPTDSADDDEEDDDQDMLTSDDGRPYEGPPLLAGEGRDSTGNVYLPEGPFKPAFRLAEGDRGSPWVYLNTWYIIGPFSHPGQDRENLDKPYAPESAVDLSAEYVGKDGKRLQWRFMQARRRPGYDTLKVVPFGGGTEWAVWYAYTEVYSDRDQELYVALASDDYGVLWVNDEVAWRSATETQAWIPFSDPAPPRVRFREGINRILFKLENAGGTTGFSMAIYTDPDPDIPPGDPMAQEDE